MVAVIRSVSSVSSVFNLKPFNTEDTEDLREIHCTRKGATEAAPSFLRSSPARAGRSRLHYEPFTTSRLFSTLKTPKTWLARMPAICLSIAVATVP